MGTRQDANIMTNTDKLNGWEQWGKYVVKTLDQLGTRYEKQEDKLDCVDTRLVKVEGKVGRIFYVSNILLGILITVFTSVCAWAIIVVIKHLFSL